jgi:hypothetical protein
VISSTFLVNQETIALPLFGRYRPCHRLSLTTHGLGQAPTEKRLRYKYGHNPENKPDHEYQ